MQHPVHVRHAVRTALALQHLAYIRLAVRACNYIDAPPVNCQNWDFDWPTTTNTSYPQRSSSCTSTIQPTPATCNDRPAAYNDSTDLSYPQRSSSCIQRLDRHQLPAMIVQLHTSTTRPASATHNDRPAARIHNSTNISYPQRSFSRTHLRLDQHLLPATIVQLHTSTTRPYQLPISPI